MTNTPKLPNGAQLDRWLVAIARGDRDALAHLYQATGTAVFAYALSVVKNQSDAEDVLHDTFVSVFHNAGEYRSQGKPMAWIITIARNHSYKLLKFRQRYVTLDEYDWLKSLPVDPDDRLLLQQCLRALTDEERQIVVLHAVAGCRFREIGKFLGLNTSTTLSKYHRAIKKLRDRF